MKKWIIGLFFCAILALPVCSQEVKNLIWLIGDGMGPGTMGFFMEGVRNTSLPQYPDQRSVLEKFINVSVTGMYFNNTYDTVVTDSACAATQMACGTFSRPGRIGINFEGNKVVTLMEEALKQGKSVGVVTDSYVADATPAGFFTHASHRREKTNIARQLVASGAQVIMGGGLKYFTGKENKKLLKEAKKKGWTIVTNRRELTVAKNGRILGLFAEEAMPFYGEAERYPQTPTLVEMAKKAVEVLSQNKQGFILLVEAGKVDWALHDNEMGPVLWEMINLDETLAYLWDFTRQSEDTLLYVNADHETGVPSFHYAHLDEKTVQHKSAQGEMLYDDGKTDYVNTPYLQYLFNHKRMLYYVYQEFRQLPPEQQTAEKLQEMTDETTGHHWDLQLEGQVPSYQEFINRLNAAQGMVWATGNHSSGLLLGLAYGPGSNSFAGVYHNTDLKNKFEKVLGF